MKPDYLCRAYMCLTIGQMYATDGHFVVPVAMCILFLYFMVLWVCNWIREEREEKK